MKKKILLIALAVAMLTLVFALSVGAEELKNDKGVYYSTSNEFGTVNILDVMTPVTSSVKTDAENYTTTYYATHSLEQRVVLANGDGTFSTYPTAYIMNINNSDWKLVGINPAKINDFTGYSYTMESIIRIELPEGITRIGHDERTVINIRTATNCVYLSLPASYSTSSGTQMGNAFQGMTSLVTIDMSKCTKMAYINGGWFRDCTSLTNILWPQSGLTAIYNGAFVKCTSLKTLVIPEGVNLPKHTQNDYGAFGGCTALESVTFPSTMTTIHKRAFDGCTSLSTINWSNSIVEIHENAFSNTAVTSVSLPNSVTTLGNAAFSNCKSLTTMRLGASLQQINKETFYGCSALTTVYVPATVTKIVEKAFQNSSVKALVYTGTLEQWNTLLSASQTSNNAIITKTPVAYSEFVYDENTQQVAYGANICEVFYNNIHELDPEKSNACAGVCANCGKQSLAANPVHNYVTVIAYTNYLANGTKTQTCQNEGCVHNVTPNVTEVAPVISSFKGYSTKIDGEGLTFGYTIDYEALDELVKVNGKAVELGFVVAAKALLGENAPLTSEGVAASEKVVKASIVNWTLDDEANAKLNKYTGADFKLSGNWENAKDAELYMAGYLLTDNSVEYLNVNGSGDTADYTTYNKVLASENVTE